MQKRYDKKSSLSYALGTTLTFELLNRKKEVAKTIYISPKQKRDETYQKLVKLAKANHISVIENNEKIFSALSEKENTMVIGEFEKFEEKPNPNNNQLVLVHPSNMGNLGTILRAAAAFGIFDIALIRPAVDVFDPKCVRASMGAIFSLHFSYYDSFEEYQKENDNHHFYPFMLQAESLLTKVEKKAPFALIYGNEATGLDPSFLKVGTPVLIPQSSLVDSLNLDNAVSIGLYEFLAR